MLYHQYVFSFCQFIRLSVCLSYLQDTGPSYAICYIPICLSIPINKSYSWTSLLPEGIPAVYSAIITPPPHLMASFCGCACHQHHSVNTSLLRLLPALELRDCELWLRYFTCNKAVQRRGSWLLKPSIWYPSRPDLQDGYNRCRICAFTM